MVIHTLHISEKANLRVKIYKQNHHLNNVSEVFEALIMDAEVSIE